MGLATARAFAQAGAAVTAADIDLDVARAEADKLVADGHQANAVRCDVSEEDQIAAAVDETAATFGRLDAAYNNAGIQSPVTDAAEETLETFERVQGINLRGVWASMKHELRHMRAQGSGAIVNCSSIGG